MIQVVSRAMKIMEILGQNRQKAYTLKEIAETLSLDKGTCSCILKTLYEGGFVQQEAPRKGYTLGYKFYHLIGRPVENEELTVIARRDIEELGEILNETILLSVIRNDRRVVLYHTEPKQVLIAKPTFEKSIYSACTGRVILANYTPNHLEKVLIRIGLPSIKEWPEIYESGEPEKQLMNALTKIKRDGYAIHHDANGIVGFAAPLFFNSHVEGSLGTFLPQNRLTDAEAILTNILHYAGEINKKLDKIEKFRIASGQQKPLQNNITLYNHKD